MIDFVTGLIYVAMLIALSWGIYYLYPTKKDVKGTESIRIIVSLDKVNFHPEPTRLTDVDT